MWKGGILQNCWCYSYGSCAWNPPLWMSYIYMKWQEKKEDKLKMIKLNATRFVFIKFNSNSISRIGDSFRKLKWIRKLEKAPKLQNEWCQRYGSWAWHSLLSMSFNIMMFHFISRSRDSFRKQNCDVGRRRNRRRRIRTKWYVCVRLSKACDTKIIWK